MFYCDPGRSLSREATRWGGGGGGRVTEGGCSPRLEKQRNKETLFGQN